MPITRTPIIDDDGSGTTGTVIDNAFKQELYNQIDAFVGPFTGAWSQYTPLWTASAGTPAIGNGFLGGRFIRMGKTIHFVIWLTAGPTTTFGTAGCFWLFATPSTMAISPSGVAMAPFTCSILNSGGAGYGPCTGYGNSTQIYFATSSNALVGQAVPFTWGASCQLFIRGTYEEA